LPLGTDYAISVLRRFSTDLSSAVPCIDHVLRFKGTAYSMAYAGMQRGGDRSENVFLQG